MKLNFFNQFGYHRLQNRLGHRKLSHQVMGLLMVASALGIVAWMVTSLWNLTIVEITGLPTLSLWQTLAIMVLIRTLSWLVGYPTRHASLHPPYREMSAWQSEIPDV